MARTSGVIEHAIPRDVLSLLSLLPDPSRSKQTRAWQRGTGVTVRKCSTCKYYEPAPIWRKGWCRNPLLYSPQQSHLVGEDDLDCDRGMGNYWEPIDGAAADAMDAPDAQSESEGAASVVVAPVQFAGLRRKAGAQGDGGDDMGQYPPSGTRRPFGDDEDDEDLDPRDRYGATGRMGGTGGGTGGGGGGGGPERQFNYNPDERYWTDYIRIALPVLGVIVLLALVWFWVNNLLGNDNKNNVAGTTASPTTISIPNINLGSPTATSAAGVPPTHIAGTATSSTGAGATPPASATLKAGGKAVVSAGGTGVNMRASPNTTAEIVAKLADGTDVTITGDSKAGENYTWWPVKVGDKTGWIAGDFLKPAA